MSQGHLDPRSFGIWTVITIATAVAGGAATCGWTVGRSVIQDELSQLKQSNEWALPATLKALKELSTEIKLDAVQKTELERLRSGKVEIDIAKREFDKQIDNAKREYDKQLTAVNAQIKLKQVEMDDAKREFDKQLAAANAQLMLMEAKLNSYEGESFDLEEGDSHFVIPKVLAIGLIDCSTISNEAEVQFGKETRKLKPGMPIEVTFEGKLYSVILRTIKRGQRVSDCATFTVSEPREYQVTPKTP